MFLEEVNRKLENMELTLNQLKEENRFAFLSIFQYFLFDKTKNLKDLQFFVDFKLLRKSNIFGNNFL